MSEEIDELTVQYEEDGLVTVKELDKKVDRILEKHGST